MSINEHFEHVKRIAGFENFRKYDPSRREFLKRAAIGAIAIGGVTELLFTAACAPAPVHDGHNSEGFSPSTPEVAKSPEELAAETEAENNLKLYQKAMNHETVKDNPDRAVLLTVAAIHSPEPDKLKAMDTVLSDYNTARTSARASRRIQEDQAAVLAAAASVNPHGKKVEQAMAAYDWFLGTPKLVETPAQAAALASIALINTSDGKIDTVVDRFTQAKQQLTQVVSPDGRVLAVPSVNTDEAIALTQYSFLREHEHTSSSEMGMKDTKEAFAVLSAHPGISKQTAILMLPAVAASGGDATPVIAKFEEVKAALDPQTPDKDRVAADIVAVSGANGQDHNRAVYIYNHTGYVGGYYGGGVDYCRSWSLAAARGNAALTTNHATQGLVRAGMPAPHADFHSVYVSGKNAGVGAGSAATGRGGYTNSGARFGGTSGAKGGGGFGAGGRGGVAGGGVGGSGGG